MKTPPRLRPRNSSKDRMGHQRAPRPGRRHIAAAVIEHKGPHREIERRPAQVMAASGRGGGNPSTPFRHSFNSNAENTNPHRTQANQRIDRGRDSLCTGKPVRRVHEERLRPTRAAGKDKAGL